MGNRLMTREELDVAQALRMALAFSNLAPPRQTILAVARRLVQEMWKQRIQQRYYLDKERWQP